MAFTYVAANVWVQAQDTVRFLVGDVKSDDALAPDDNEVLAALRRYGLVAASDALGNATKVFNAAADLAEAFRARLARESEVVLTEVGQTKADASRSFAALAKDLRQKARAGIMPSFANPQAYPTTFVQGVDSLPNLE